ncbi:MAG TPA: hypothetical protein VGM81_18475 [Burkholderiaceae bacterium]|jgi:hypothetical protein
MKLSIVSRAAALALARALGTTLVVGVTFSLSFALLRYWHLPGGDEPDSAALLAKAPRTHRQEAPQLARQETVLQQSPQQLGARSPAMIGATDAAFIGTPNE